MMPHQLETEMEFCARREKEERAAVDAYSAGAVRDVHFVMAERYADKRWSLHEIADL